MEKQDTINDRHETFSNFTEKMLRAIVRDTIEADVESARRLLE